MGPEFIPKLDGGDRAGHALRIPGTSLTTSLEMQFQIERSVKQIPEVKTYFSRVGTAEVATDPMPPNHSDGYVTLKDKKDWPDPEKPEAEVVAELEQALASVPGGDYEASQPNTLRFTEQLTGLRSDH